MSADEDIEKAIEATWRIILNDMPVGHVDKTLFNI